MLVKVIEYPSDAGVLRFSVITFATIGPLCDPVKTLGQPLQHRQSLTVATPFNLDPVRNSHLAIHTPSIHVRCGNQ